MSFTLFFCVLSVIGNKAKGRIAKRVFQEIKACQIFRKTTIKECSFFGTFGVLCLLRTPVLRFALLAFFCVLGSIPQRFINRLSAEQPMFANTIRKHCERRYKDQDPPHDVGDHFIEKLSRVPSVFEKPLSPKLEAELESIFTHDEGKKKVDNLPNEEILTNGIDDSPRSVDAEILSPVNGHDTKTIPNPNEKHKNEDGNLTNGDIIHQDRNDAEGTSTPKREKNIQGNVEKEEDGFIITNNHCSLVEDDAGLNKDNSIVNDLELRSMSHVSFSAGGFALSHSRAIIYLFKTRTI